MNSNLQEFDSVPFDVEIHREIGFNESLIALEAIKNLKSRYLAAVDNKDWPAMEEIFTSDAVIDFSGEDQYHVGHHGMTAEHLNPVKTVVRGGKEAAVRIEKAVGGIITVHQGHDPQLTLTSPLTAKGKWTLYDQLDYGNEVMHGYGHYHETYLLKDGRWQISSLLLTRIKVDWE